MDETEAPDPDRYQKLPEPVALEDTIEVKDASPVPDPEAGRNTEQDFTLRFAGG